ncbi:hypothetical protein RIF29_00300 [Crotalaria pallida]|uniref:Protein SCAR n=1 Tax=Crotalaria pallida TaxID=3830 RepID=A0AAN9IW01_CROPI
MPISRYHIRSEYSLADPELYRRPEYDVPESLLEGVSMAGLVGFLRQLGDLAQFAAEIFHDLHEEVIATTERGQSLVSRVQQLEAEVPAIEKAFLSQTYHSSFFTNGGIDWHPNLRSEENLVTRGDLPRFIMDSYEECRGPPRLFLLDKFDVAGAGACLKRYTDPSFFKVDSSCSGIASVEVCREEKQKKGGCPSNSETPVAVSSHAKLHQLFLEERIENAHSDPARLVKLKKKQLNGSAVEAKTGISYMEKILEVPSPDHKVVRETSTTPLHVKLMSDDTSETGIKILEISSITPVKRSLRKESTSPRSRLRQGLQHGSSQNAPELELKPYSEMEREMNGDVMKVHEQISPGVTDEMSSNHPMVPDETEMEVDEQKKMEYSLDGYRSDDVTSEVDYMDALAIIDSDLEADDDFIPKKSLLNVQQVTDLKGREEHQLQARFSDSQSFGYSSTSDEISSFKLDRNREHAEVPSQLSDSQSTGSSYASDDISSLRRERNDKHAQLQAQFSDSHSIGNSSTSEIEDIPSNQLPQTVELQKTSCGTFVMHDDALVQGEGISDYNQVSAGSCVMDSGLSDLQPPSPLSLPTETQMDETPSGPVELHLRLEDGEDIKCLVESTVAIPDALSLVQDHSCPVASSDVNSLNNLDVRAPYVHSNAMLQVSNDLNLAREDECGDHSEVNVFLAESPNEHSSEVSVNEDIGSQGEGPICSSLEVDLNSANGEDIKSEDGITATEFNSEDLSHVVEASPLSSFTQELCDDFTFRNPPDEPHSTEVLRMIHGHGISGSTCSVDLVEDGVHVEHPSSTSQDNHEMVHDMFTIKVQSEDQAVSALPSVDNDETDISSPSRDLPNLHECFPGSSDSHKMEIKLNEVEWSKTSIDLNAEKRENQLKPSLDILSSPMNDLTELEESFDTLADPRQKEMDVDEAVVRESLAELPTQAVVSEPEITSADVRSNLNTSVPCDPSDSVICNNIQYSSLKEKIQYSSYINDMKMVPVCSDLVSTDEENEESYTSEMFQPQQMQISNQLERERISLAASEFASEIHPDEPSSCDYSSKGPDPEINPTKHVMDPFKPLISELFPKAAKINLEEAPPLPPLPPMQWIMGKAQQASIFSQREEIEETQTTFQPIQPVKPDEKSRFGLPTSERETLVYQNPFLPIMGVESNKHQRFPGFSTGVSEHPVAVPLQFPVMVNEANGQHDYISLERSQIQNPFSTLPMVSTGWPPHGYVLASDREMVQNSNPFFPIPPADCAVSGGDISPHVKSTQSPSQSMEEASLEVKKDGPGEPAEGAVSGGDPISPQEKPTQSPSQSMEETSLEVKKDIHGELHLVQPAECVVSGDDPISPYQRPAQSPSQLMEVTSLEVKTVQHLSGNIEREQDPSISHVPQPSIEIEQPNHRPVPSEGEMVLSLEKSAQTPEFDNEMANGEPKNKLPRPRNPLIEAFDKSKLRKVTDRVRPHLAPKEDERDSLLEQIRTKSFNLKPAVTTRIRPSIQGPRTNLRVAAMLEKANAIRQALAGSDEDDDADTWSDC